MSPGPQPVLRRLLLVSLPLLLALLTASFLGLGFGVTGSGLRAIWEALLALDSANLVQQTIVWRIRLPRVLMAAEVGATLSLGGLVFQALLRNPLAEPYILGISGGSAVGAISGILLGLSRFPGVSARNSPLPGCF